MIESPDVARVRLSLVPATSTVVAQTTHCRLKEEPDGGKGGPDLDNLQSDAKKANKGPLPVYVKQSIEVPSAYVVPGFPNGVMPPYKGKLTDAQINDLVKFLTTQS